MKTKATTHARKEAERRAPFFNTTTEKVLEECMLQALKEKELGINKHGMVMLHHVEAWFAAGVTWNTAI